MDAVFDDAEKRIDHAMNALEFYRLAAPVVGAIKCGHTQLGLPEALQKQFYSGLPLFPAEVAVLNDKAYVFRDYANEDARLAGAEAFEGRVFALMNGGSFSTTGEFLSTLHFHHRATFVGSETAAAYYGNTSGIDAPLVLPNSKLQLDLPLVTYYLAVGGNPHANRGIMPDVPVSYSIDDLVVGRDKELETALELARKP